MLCYLTEKRDQQCYNLFFLDRKVDQYLFILSIGIFAMNASNFEKITILCNRIFGNLELFLTYDESFDM